MRSEPLHSPSTDVHVWDEDAQHAQVSRERLFLLHTAGPATTENIQSLVRNFDRFARETPGPLGFVLQAVNSTRPPQESDRGAVIEMMRRHAQQLGAVALCMSSSGFAAAAQRSVVSAVFLLSNPGYPAKVFGDLTAGLVWTANRIGMPIPLVTAVSESAADRLDR